MVVMQQVTPEMSLLTFLVFQSFDACWALLTSWTFSKLISATSASFKEHFSYWSCTSLMRNECCKLKFTKNVDLFRFGCNLLRIQNISCFESFLPGKLFNESLCTIQHKIFFLQFANQYQKFSSKPSPGTLEARFLI